MRQPIGNSTPKWWSRAGQARRAIRGCRRTGLPSQNGAIHLARCNADQLNGLGMREGAERKPGLTQQERSRILALVKQPPPGRLERYTDGSLQAREEEGPAHWSLDAFTEAAHAAGIQVERERDPAHLPA